MNRATYFAQAPLGVFPLRSSKCRLAMSLPALHAEVPTVIDDSQSQEGATTRENDQNPEMHKPEGEEVLTLPVLDEPKQKKAKLAQASSATVVSRAHASHQSDTIPTNFRVKWIQTTAGLVPYVMDEATSIIYCGLARMQVFRTDGIATVLCLKGCHWNCSGHQTGHCGCHCHTLQWHYNTR